MLRFMGGLACCDSRAHNESDMTERLNCTELNGVLCIMYIQEGCCLWKGGLY